MPNSTDSRDTRFRSTVREVSRWCMICGAGAMLISAAACSPCMNNPCDNGLACDGLETCTDDGGTFVCSDGTPVACDFPTFCTEPDGACVDPCAGADCDDQNHCTTDSCVTNEDGTTTCDNGLACDGLETCFADGGQAVCTDGTPIECEFPTFCTEPDGACVDPCEGADCTDDNPCTTDSCVTNQDGTTSCDSTETGCDDDDACTENDACDPAGEVGNCVGTLIECPEGGECVNGSCPCSENATCDDGDACNGVETCDTSAGTCVAGTPLDCDDDDLCTVDACDATAGCSNTAKECAEGEMCDPATGECGSTNVGLSLSQETVSFDHEVGVTECPQEFGNFVVTNTGNVETDYAVLVGSAPLSATPFSFTLAPGASQTVTVEFTCAQATSFEGTITITGKAAGQTATAALAVTGTVG